LNRGEKFLLAFMFCVAVVAALLTAVESVPEEEGEDLNLTDPLPDVVERYTSSPLKHTNSMGGVCR